jgi:hypothetical protein
MSSHFSKTEKIGLTKFLERRTAKAPAIGMLEHAVTQEGLKRGELSVAKNMTYSTVVDEIDKAISKEWVTEGQLTSLLDRCEIAGRQHVCVFTLPEKGVDEILDELRDPDQYDDEEPALEDFWEIPASSYARIIKDANDTVLVKIVAKRRYWRSEIDSSSDEEQWIHKWIQEERSAIVVKCSKASGTVQIRVPPREHAQSDTGKTVYDFITEVLPTHYSLDHGSWFSKLLVFPITDAFPSLLKNKDDFVLRYDTPENNSAKSRLMKKGPVKQLDDLRDDSIWNYGKGYARATLRGSWVIEDGDPIFCHLNWDRVRVDASTNLEFARVFVPNQVNDDQLDYVIKRIRDHLP